jgi:hypothetical protein
LQDPSLAGVAEHSRANAHAFLGLHVSIVCPTASRALRPCGPTCQPPSVSLPLFSLSCTVCTTLWPSNTCHHRPPPVTIRFAIRLVPVVGCLYLCLNHATSAFSFPLDHQCSSSRLQHPAHSHISIIHVSLLSPSQHHHSRLNHFRIYFWTTKLRK